MLLKCNIKMQNFYSERNFFKILFGCKETVKQIFIKIKNLYLNILYVVLNFNSLLKLTSAILRNTFIVNFLNSTENLKLKKFVFKF